MNAKINSVVVCLFFFSFSSVAGVLHYVDVNSATPTPPFTSWATAARAIQDAVDAAMTGDEVIVTNGTYATGGRAVSGTMTNRVAVDRALFVHSVNGPQYTIIRGYQVPSTTNGDGAIRCVYVTNGANLSGFTLTNGATRVAGDFFTEECGGGVFSEQLPSIATVSNCVIIGNSAQAGGGAFQANLIDCLVISNAAPHADGYAQGGGGVQGGMVTNCTIVGNSGAGAYGWYFGHGGVSCTLYNCIVYYNGDGDCVGNLCSPNYCCTPPSFVTGSGNITNEPMFVNLAGGNLRLQSNSPCINAGNNSYVSSITDLDGNPRIFAGVADMGAYEFQGPPPPTHYVNVTNPTPAPPYTSWATAATNIQDAVDVSFAGDGVVVTNGIYANGGKIVTGVTTNRVAVERAIFLHSVNGPQFTTISGYQVPGTANGSSAVRCVYLTNGAVLSGFTLTNGATAGDSGGGILCETNAAVSNCVIAGNSASFGGGAVASGTLDRCLLAGNTAALGGGAYLSNLRNCNVLNNTAGGNFGGFGGGGGVFGGNLDNCKVIGNSATYAGGGGVSASPNGTLFSGRVTINNCLIMSNSCLSVGGAVSTFSTSGEAVLNNCTVVGNTAGDEGGGIWATNGSLNNSIIYYNTAPSGSNYNNKLGHEGLLKNNCTTPMPAPANGTITNEPMFVGLATADLHLQSNSPCINAGNNSYVTNSTDLDGNPRIRAGTVDIGAYEFQYGASSIAPQLGIILSGQTITLSWPLWASNFVLQAASGIPANSWSPVGAPVTTTEQENRSSLPLDGSTKFFRLLVP